MFGGTPVVSGLLEMAWVWAAGLLGVAALAGAQLARREVRLLDERRAFAIEFLDRVRT